MKIFCPFRNSFLIFAASRGCYPLRDGYHNQSKKENHAYEQVAYDQNIHKRCDFPVKERLRNLCLMISALSCSPFRINYYRIGVFACQCGLVLPQSLLVSLHQFKNRIRLAVLTLYDYYQFQFTNLFNVS